MATGQISWVELHSEDPDTMAKFYESVFNWEIQRDPTMGDYIMWRDPSGQLGGGFSKDMPKTNGQLYLDTPNIEESLKAVEAAGGKSVRERTPISEEIGSWAQFEDPSGNVLGLFEQPQR